MSGVKQTTVPESTSLLGHQTGLSEAEAARRLAATPRHDPRRSSRSHSSIVRANVLTVFNLILAAFGVVTLAFGDARDALFLGVIVANSAIGITQEVRAKRALDRLSLLVAPHTTVSREGATRSVPVEQLVVDDVVVLAPGYQLPISPGAPHTRQAEHRGRRGPGDHARLADLLPGEPRESAVLRGRAAPAAGCRRRRAMQSSDKGKEAQHDPHA
jgi:hypothetical protein